MALTGMLPPNPQAEVGENAAVAGAVKVARAEGVFSYDQEAVTPNETIRTMFQKAVRVVCGAGIALASENPLDWQLTVSGAVNDAYTASVGDLAGDESVQQKMTCTCGGNPAGGRAIRYRECEGHSGRVHPGARRRAARGQRGDIRVGRWHRDHAAARLRDRAPRRAQL